MIHYIIYELHLSDVKVIFDLDENPEKCYNKLYTKVIVIHFIMTITMC